MKTIALVLSVVLLLVAGGLLLLRFVAQRGVAARLRMDAPNGADSLEKIRLGGVEQWIQIRGRDRSRPILLFLHGGPGFPEMPFAHLHAALADDFVVVHWDQRGAGKSYASTIAPNSMTVGQIVADTHELTGILLQRFGGTKIYLVAHSWGTIIGARTAAQYPELFYAYVALSQVANPPESERLMYRFALEAAQKANVEKAVAELTRIGLPPYEGLDDYKTMNRWIHRFGGNDGELGPKEFVRLGFASPAYSLADIARLWFGFRFSFSHLWREAFAIDFFREIPRLEVPVYFFLGRHDRTSTASAELAARYFAALDAPRGKELIWFEKSAHWPQLSEPEKYRKFMVETVLPQTRRMETTPHD